MAEAQVAKVSLEAHESGVAIIRLGAPEERVVTLTLPRMQSLQEVIQKLRAAPPKGIVICGPSAEMFTAGADVNAIRDVRDPTIGENLARMGQSLFNEIEALPCPKIAAISGPCVGGGCELALACDYRIISDHKTSIIGLPEVKLGILPGFGGTQRLPRLVGIRRALDIILAGKTLRAPQALRAGVVQEVVKFDDLLSRAITLAKQSPTPKPAKLPLLERLLTFTGIGRSFVRKQTVPMLKKQTKGFYPAPPAALEAVLRGLELGVPEGLKYEAMELGRLIVTAECKSLVKLFFLTEASKGLGKAARKDVDDIHAMVVGAGTMGAGIATVLAKAESAVILRDTTDEAVQRGMGHVRRSLDGSKSLSPTDKSFILNRIEATAGESVHTSSVNLVVEAVFEEMSVKKKLFSELAGKVAEKAILATNTSSLSVTEIASSIERPERVVGMHFFNPVEKMPLVEIVRGAKTSDRTILIIAALTAKLGKFPIVVSDVPGFLVNRVLSPYLSEAAWLLESGYSIGDIDRAATSFGMPMGPLRLLDEIGLDVAAHVADSMVKGYGERMKAPTYAKTLSDAGRKGKKSGNGFYDFSDGKGTPHGGIRELLKITKPEKTGGDSKPIVNRLILSFVNEAVRCLDDGVAGVPGEDAANQINLGTVMGIGFPPFRGGILHYADSLGARAILESLQSLEREHGMRFSPAPGIRKRAEKQKGFHQAL